MPLVAPALTGGLRFAPPLLGEFDRLSRTDPGGLVMPPGGERVLKGGSAGPDARPWCPMGRGCGGSIVGSGGDGAEPVPSAAAVGP